MCAERTDVLQKAASCRNLSAGGALADADLSNDLPSSAVSARNSSDRDLPVVLKLESFRVGFAAPDGPDGSGGDARGGARTLWAVDGVDLELRRSDTVGIVGESGCGKSVLSHSILRLLEHEQLVLYGGKVGDGARDFLQLPLSEMRDVRGKQIAMVFQDPLSSFDPLSSVDSQIAEAFASHGSIDRRAAKKAAISAMQGVGIENARERYKSRPSSYSGGQLQRLMIAMACAKSPSVLIADEPTTALDATTQAVILEQLKTLVSEQGMAMLFLSHDLSVVANVCERVCVMYAGRFMEKAQTRELFLHPRHPYTKALIDAVPSVVGEKPHRLAAIPGRAPSLAERGGGCRFCARCPRADERCAQEEPQLGEIGCEGVADAVAAANAAGLVDLGRAVPASHLVRCWHPLEVGASNAK